MWIGLRRIGEVKICSYSTCSCGGGVCVAGSLLELEARIKQGMEGGRLRVEDLWDPLDIAGRKGSYRRHYIFELKVKLGHLIWRRRGKGL